MLKPLIAALIAATTLVPASALAQDRHRGDRGSDRGSWAGNQGSQDGSSRRGEWRQRSDNGGGGNWRARQPATVTPAPAPAPTQQSQQWQGRRSWNGGQQDGQQSQWRGRRDGDGQSQWQGRRDSGQRWQGTPQAQQPQQWQGRRDGNRSWNGDRGGNRDWNSNRSWRGDRGDRSWSGNRWNNRWRGDNRYNWRDYRNHNRNIFRMPRYYAPQGWGYGYHRYSIGGILSSLLFSQSYWIDDPFYYRLPPAYGPYRWVRYYNDALLVDIYTGEVVDVEYDIFW